MNRADLPGLVVAAFGLSSEELTALKILRPSSYPMINCTDNFELLLTKRPICIVLNPLALNEKQREQLNDYMLRRRREADSPIFLATQDAEDILTFPALHVSLTARRDRTRSKIMKQLKETDIDPFFAFDYSKAAPAIALNDGFVVLDADMNTYARTSREIIRISAAYVADFKCADRFETLVHTSLPISRAVKEDTGITNEKLSGAPSLLEALQMLDNWHSFNVVLAAYNWEYLSPVLSAVREQYEYDFGKDRVKLDLRKLLLRMFPAYFSQNYIDINSAAALIPWRISSHGSYCEKLTELLIFALRNLRQNSDIHMVADIFQLYQDNDFARTNLKIQQKGYEQ